MKELVQPGTAYVAKAFKYAPRRTAKVNQKVSIIDIAGDSYLVEIQDSKGAYTNAVSQDYLNRITPPSFREVQQEILPPSDPSRGARDNAGKLQWSLIDYPSMEDFVRVLEFGAAKYTKRLTLSLENLLHLCRTQNVAQTIQIVRSSPKDYVDPATTSNSRRQIRSIREDNKRIVLTGVQNFQVGVGSNKSSVSEILHQSKELQNVPQIKQPDFTESMGSQSKSMKSSKAWDAAFADRRFVYTLTIATTQEGSEEFCVVSATKESDCLMTIFNVLKELSYISKATYLEDNTIIVPGAWNWKKGLPVTEILESAQRHMAALMAGEDIDPADGLPHEAHVMCNMMFLAWMKKHRSEMDDRLSDQQIFDEAKADIQHN